ncbi:HigA family addiction module antidote protein [filamentous cyanobacterium LEGE 11480]|uniref:HigA family addiction module antidote protein n=1 Tax=Romeriopsis navalis LEGE 11480 TaxID=2777977 RepID=A0A928VTF9_9CYAN|nr:HigA family addiction module antitoxin [Romeriopsis navalis]MBE9033387.1 HigA family addiction module antidote protein [Romeriopsis navalis LEGE 11480]
MAQQTKAKLDFIHPGEILALDFLEPMKITAYQLSKSIGIQQTRISEVIADKRGITADTALRLSRYFGNSAQFWMNLQVQYDLRIAQEKNADVYAQISTVSVA